ncbi:DcaP family trimeric outer membrane transporter [Halioxenophilus aromaticivorans]|uniref:DcaP family trimeric outer membrane transporter n=1 Tax=Halioxenophilus aromaticivorans TaxID=1306992 RepID=A0AAV3U4G0_9ALTE
MSHSLTSNIGKSNQRLFTRKSLAKTLMASALATAGVFAATSTSAQSSVSDRIEELEKEIKTLKSQVGSEKTTTGVDIKPGTTFDYGGYIKADFIFSDYSDAERAGNIGDDFVIPGLIPVDPNDDIDDGDVVFDSHQKSSRFYFKTTTKVAGGSVMSYIELDFVGGADERITNRANDSLRHAFLKYSYNETDSILAGQTWSTLLNAATFPETVDFVGQPSGTIFMRQQMLRWTKGLEGGSSFSLAAENPSSGFYDGGVGFNSNNYDSNGIPDLIARYDGKAGNFSYSFAGVLRELAYSVGGVEDEDQGVGFSFAGVLAMDNGDKLKMQLNHGNLGRYIALNAFRDGAIEADGSIETMDVTGGFLAYEHKWTDKLRSTFVYAYSTADNPSSAGEGITKEISDIHANILYSPVPKLTFGGEILRAERELESGDSGDLTRLQFMAKWVF